VVAGEREPVALEVALRRDHRRSVLRGHVSPGVGSRDAARQRGDVMARCPNDHYWTGVGRDAHSAGHTYTRCEKEEGHAERGEGPCAYIPEPLPAHVAEEMAAKVASAKADRELLEKRQAEQRALPITAATREALTNLWGRFYAREIKRPMPDTEEAALIEVQQAKSALAGGQSAMGMYRLRLEGAWS
jgi:hypothetical protein